MREKKFNFIYLVLCIIEIKSQAERVRNVAIILAFPSGDENFMCMKTCHRRFRYDENLTFIEFPSLHGVKNSDRYWE